MLYPNFEDTAGASGAATVEYRDSKRRNGANPAMSNRADNAIEKPAEEPRVIQTRFGPITVSQDKPILFDRGLLGIPESQHFTLVDFPAENLKQFKLLQSLDKEELSFITLPLDLDNAIIARSDLQKACEDVNMPADKLAVLVIVSVHRSPSNVTLSVNARAPLLINADTRQALQYVFQHSRYKVQQLLNLSDH